MSFGKRLEKMKFIFAILCLVVVSSEDLTEKCEKDNMDKCLSKMQAISQQLMIEIQNSEVNWRSYCMTIEQEGQCLKHKSCEADFPIISKLTKMNNFFLNNYCRKNMTGFINKEYTDMVRCFVENDAVFRKCMPHKKFGWELLFTESTICNMTDYVQCFAKQIKMVCKNGEAYGNALEELLKIMNCKVSNEGLAEKCKQDDLNECVSNYGTAVMKFNSIRSSGKDFTRYCPTLEQEGQCLEDFSKICERVISKLNSVHHLLLSEFCEGNGRLLDFEYNLMLPCFLENNALLEKCWSQKSMFESPSTEDAMCKKIESMQCLAKLSKEKCKNGEVYGNGMEKRMEKMKKIFVCSGAGYLENSFLIIASTVLSVLLIRDRLQ